MSTAVLDAPLTTASNAPVPNFAELLERLGGIPAERVRRWPLPGTATLNDLIANNDSKIFLTCELIDGTLVEKTVGFSESQAATEVGRHVLNWNDSVDLGFGATTDGTVQLTPSQARAPDFAFYLFERFPGRMRAKGRVPLMYPDFAVEILSISNTKKEMARKRRDYFNAGTRLVWEVDLETQTVMVYREPDKCVTLGIDDTLSGEDILPGFRLPMRKWMDSLTQE